MSKYVYLAKQKDEIIHMKHILEFEEPVLEELFLFTKSHNFPILKNAVKYWWGAEGFVSIKNRKINSLSKEIMSMKKNQNVSKRTKKTLEIFLSILKRAKMNKLSVFIDAD